MGALSLGLGSQLTTGGGVAAHESLWKRAPTRTRDGGSVCDFMLLIPKLNKRRNSEIEERISCIALILSRFDKVVVFADLNLKLNLLWVSYKPCPGFSVEITTAIQERVPEAKLIAMKLD